MKKVINNYCESLGCNLNNAIINHISEYKFSNKKFIDNKHFNKFNSHQIIKNTVYEKKGVCIELNLTFAQYLKKMNYKYYFVKCFVPKNNYKFYNIWHLGIICIHGGRKFYIDVGSGRIFDSPILLPNYSNINLYYNSRLIYQIIDKPLNINEIKQNYMKFIKGELYFPTRHILYETIYDKNLKSYKNLNNYYLNCTKNSK